MLADKDGKWGQVQRDGKRKGQWGQEMGWEMIAPQEHKFHVPEFKNKHVEVLQWRVQITFRKSLKRPHLFFQLKK